MGELAWIYAIDRETSQTVGLLHDAAKDLGPSQQAEIMVQAKIEIHHEYDLDYKYYLHGPVGAYFVYRELGITDPHILNAIKMHTYYGGGDSFNEPLCWCMRFADILEPGRNWNGKPWLGSNVSRLREIVYAGHMAEGAFLQTGCLIKWFSQEKIPVHPNMERVYQELSAALGLDDSFF